MFPKTVSETYAKYLKLKGGIMIYWNKDYETYEYKHPNGYIEIFADNIEASTFAKAFSLTFTLNV